MDFARRRAAAILLLMALPGAHAGATSGTRQQRETLTRAALEMAREMLRHHGEFPPYGLGLSVGDEVVELNDAGDGEPARTAHPGDALREKLDAALKAGAVQATALVYEAIVTPVSPGTRNTDAVAIQFAHRDGYRAVIVYPYRFQGNDVVLGPPHIVEQKGALPRPRSKR